MSSVAIYQYISRYFSVLFVLCAVFAHAPKGFIQFKRTYRQLHKSTLLEKKNVVSICLNKSTTIERKLVDISKTLL